MSMPPYTLHGLGTKVLKVELVAAFAGVELHRPPFTWGLTQKTRRFLELSPTGKVSGHCWELHFGLFASKGASPRVAGQALL